MPLIERRFLKTVMDNIKPSEISRVLLEQLKDIDTSLRFEEIGKVLQVSDGVARMYGLGNAEAGELLEFESGVMGVVMNLEQDNVGAVLLGPTDEVKEGMTVRRTGRIASIKVGEKMLGRVVDPLGVPLDGLGKIEGELTEMPLERKAPGVIFRQPVTEPLQTGLKAIDAMIPIGRARGNSSSVTVRPERRPSPSTRSSTSVPATRPAIRFTASMWLWDRKVPRWPTSWRPSGPKARWTTRSSSPPPPRIPPQCSISLRSLEPPSGNISVTPAARPLLSMTTSPSRLWLTVRFP